MNCVSKRFFSSIEAAKEHSLISITFSFNNLLTVISKLSVTTLQAEEGLLTTKKRSESRLLAVIYFDEEALKTRAATGL